MTITIHGANDGAKITGDDSGSVTEDAAETTAWHLARKRRGQHRQRVPGASRCGGQYARSVWMRTASGPTCWITATRRSMR
ncbi:VCBS domain-containing protein [Vibrio japonicus]|uniref:VCBS domain-containing protein n=1 Tax=Vibrio japonicus TaxID=1824638 RepID=A0ABY5LET3_9VIBR|nr:VCBS domain-containing protein [Vibrio japonicus]UUM29445.1 VCBS domain-containing protein [Vibrio japonicus]